MIHVRHRQFLPALIAGFFLLITLCTGSQAAADQPNFLVILCDDLGYGDLECYGHPHIKTPNLNRLADQGIRFTDFYSAAPVCSPARVGLLTGQTPNRLGIYDWIPENHPMYLKKETPTTASLLRANGYQTAVCGKWHCNGKFNSDEQDQPDDNGFDYWFATQNNAAPRHQNPKNFVRNGEAVGPLEGFSCGLVAEEAIHWLKSERKTEKPFYLQVCFHEPHEPVESPQDLVEQYMGVARNEDEAQYFANVANMDRAVGNLISTIDQLGLGQDTLVVFTSDNGPETLSRYPNAKRSYGSPGEMRGMKLHIYEGGIRVAGIMRWTGQINPGQESSTPVCSLDFLPTFCSLAGVALPKKMTLDGCDVSSLLSGHEFDRPEPLFWHYYRAYSIPKVAMRDGEWKIVAHWSGPNVDDPQRRLGGNVNPQSQEFIKTAKLTRFELYRIATDPHETTDVSAQFPQVLARLSKKLTAKYEAIQQSCPEWEFPEAKQ